ncbi:hypothetical protein FEM48_ZijujUnG0089500 [Ziziphus jujuba var. spinosa]|uniref:23 kDa jasmonate-induced protein-like n=1 Tax=Ziziphus jujuba var. spinosa TaxID=714518 RepID=A0A978U8J5_ZIZJJ|nr:23 kDa jasmonate-induced protein-like [Ziziphus jujuba var. spinosa]KAH7510780.1 hypothetical protein FEM48_ZijujUnG0089500 [Ziziphus jujuba var. spinosa]
MASNVFGKPIRNQTLKAMPEYQDKEVITAVDRAYEALMMKDADNKDQKARKFVEGLKQKYDDALVSTLCFIYNATGNRLTFVGSCSWAGHIGYSPYPLLLENGQWGAFLHIQKSRNAGSIAATIYHGQDENGDAFDWMLSWYNPWNDRNRVYTEIREADKFEDIHLSNIHDQFDIHYSSATLNGCYSTATTGYSGVIDNEHRISPIFEGIMTLKNAWIQ